MPRDLSWRATRRELNEPHRLLERLANFATLVPQFKIRALQVRRSRAVRGCGDVHACLCVNPPPNRCSTSAQPYVCSETFHPDDIRRRAPKEPFTRATASLAAWVLSVLRSRTEYLMWIGEKQREASQADLTSGQWSERAGSDDGSMCGGHGALPPSPPAPRTSHLAFAHASLAHASGSPRILKRQRRGGRLRWGTRHGGRRRLLQWGGVRQLSKPDASSLGILRQAPVTV